MLIFNIDSEQTEKINLSSFNIFLNLRCAVEFWKTFYNCSLQLNFTKATNDWTGYIVKLHFYCARNNLAQANTADINCIVVKFKGTAICK